MFKMTLWNVQHGSATYLKTPFGKHIVVDLGTGKSGNMNFSPLLHLKNTGVTLLHHVIITHPHTDHIDDIFNFDLMSPKVLNRPSHLTKLDILNANRPTDRAKIDKYLELDRRYVHAIPNADKVWLPEFNGGVTIKQFTPSNCPTSNINNHSIVVVIEYLGVKIILPGDNETPSWFELLANPAFCSAISGKGVFIASHHGRESGFCKELFSLFTPYITCISDGPVGSTSVTSKYTEVSEGWKVRKRSTGEFIERKCLTTRCDGPIDIAIYQSNAKTYLDVSVD